MQLYQSRRRRGSTESHETSQLGSIQDSTNTHGSHNNSNYSSGTAFSWGRGRPLDDPLLNPTASRSKISPPRSLFASRSAGVAKVELYDTDIISDISEREDGTNGSPTPYSQF
jgi:hypothetical protein